MAKVKIYVEGGGDGNKLRTACRRGFSEFLEKAGLRGKMPSIVACGSRDDAYKRFRTAVKLNKQNEIPLLLVDREEIVRQDIWEHLAKRDGWQQPKGAHNDQTHFMIVCMESWLVADPDSLENYYGQGFNRKLLPRRDNLEKVNKKDIFNALKNATKNTQKGDYSKGDHSFELLKKIDPVLVQRRCAGAKVFVEYLRKA